MISGENDSDSQTTDSTSGLTMDQEVRIEPHHMFGLRREARNNLHFMDEQTIVFPSGNNCVLYNVHQQWTKFIPGEMSYQQEKQAIKALAISPDRFFLAVSVCGAQSTVSVYDIQSDQCTKMQVLTGGDIEVKEFVCMAFSADSKYLLCQAGGPGWNLFYWDWENNNVIAIVQTTKLGFVSQVSFNPVDNTQICVSGNYVFSIFKLENDFLKISAFTMDCEYIKSHAWLSENSIVLGTKTGNLLLLEGGVLLSLTSPSERQMVNCDTSSISALPGITVITTYSKGFACAGSLGEVCLYEKTGEFDYKKAVEIRIPQDPCSSEPSVSAQQEVKSMCLSPSEETLAISTRQGQIYHVNLTSVENSQSKLANFEYLFHSLHTGSITDLSVSSSKPLLATCSKDNSVHIWNYKTNSLELHQEFPEEPNCISLHPNGLSILVGFSDKVHLMNLLVDQFCPVQEFDIHDCSECAFNHDGSTFAAISDNLISIVNIRTGDKVDLNGHLDTVELVKWSKDDRRLVLLGTDGAVREWNVLTGECTLNESRGGEILREMASKDTSYTAISVTQSALREMASNEMSYTAISMTQSGQAVFVGTATGTVRVMQYQIEEVISWTEHRGHCGPITKMLVTPGDQYLVTASEDGSLLIWTITDQVGDQLSMVKEACFTEEVPCSNAFLEIKDKSLLEVQSLIESLNEELECNPNLTNMDFKKKLEEVKENFLNITEKLNTEKEEQKISQDKALREMREKHVKELKFMENKHAEEIFQAFAVQESLEEKIQKLHSDYEEKLRTEEEKHLSSIEIKQAYDQKLLEQQNSLQQFQEMVQELLEKTDTEIIDTLLQQELQEEEGEEEENNMKLEDETVLTENKMVHFWKKEGEIQCESIEPSQLEGEINSKNKIIENLQQKLHVQKEELCKERSKVRSLKTVLQKIKADIQECSSFIRQPTLLRNNFKKLQKCYIHEADVKHGRKAGLVIDHTKEKEQSEMPEPKPPLATTTKIQKTKAVQEVVKDCASKLEMELMAEKEICSNLKNKTKLMEKQFRKITEEIQVQNLEVSMLKEEVQNLHGHHKDRKKLKSLRKEKEQNKTVQEQKIHLRDIVEMHKQTMIQNEVALNSINNQLDELIEDRNRPMEQMDETKLERVKKRIKAKKLFFRKVRNVQILVNRMKADIQTCSEFIQQPKTLKENFIKLYKCYIKGTDVSVGEKTATQKQGIRQKEQVNQMKSLAFVPRPPQTRPKIQKTSAVPREDFNQETDKNHRDRTQGIRTMRINSCVKISKDTQKIYGGVPKILTHMLSSRRKRIKPSSSGYVKLPPINMSRGSQRWH
ncbi:cilia- and flagella-associated protein 57-like isoform X2 [Tachysurus fulvidraco]|uniref:cilia- and flagella-associated protein 57-like isoform X2 n=1 Tax=Tachysurus fulvidraco TaxID=1234273 RepID=UPI001FEFAA62|nr:cilia- and flagella-associated protein 57-like isoform X2 [Tachysurus fulvidraco]